MKLLSILCASRTASSTGEHSGCHSGSECQVPKSGTLALSSVWHLALWHSAPFGTWHFGTQLRLALGTLALSSGWHLALWHSRTDWHLALWHSIPLAPAISAVPVGVRWCRLA